MTSENAINTIEKLYKGKRFWVIGDHPHANEKVRVLGFHAIKGCTMPGLLVKNFRLGKESQFLRVFNLSLLHQYYPK